MIFDTLWQGGVRLGRQFGLAEGPCGVEAAVAESVARLVASTKI